MVSPSPLLRLPGAVAAPNGLVAMAYGNPLAEQRAALERGALIDLSHRGVVTVSGSERLSWLDSLLSQRLLGLAPGESTEALLLDPHGHVQQAMRIVDDGETTWMLVDENRAEALTAWLTKMVFFKDVRVSDVSGDNATVGYFGHASLPALVTWRDPWAHVSAGGWEYAEAGAEHPAHTWNYAEAVIERADLATLTDRSWAGLTALEALRIAAWRPSVTTEGDDGLLPHEVDWLRTAVHLNKGCYRGQETVAKVHNLGHPPRRLVLLDLDGSLGTLPEPGAPIEAEGVTVGRITASARHFEAGPIALGIVKRSLAPDVLLTVPADGTDLVAHQVVIVPTDAGRTVSVPKIPRLGAQPRASTAE
jgi:folate-binding protein YgfZ